MENDYGDVGEADFSYYSDNLGRFDYIIDKIDETPLSQDPFKHLYIADFFSDNDFREIVSAPEIDIPPVADDDALIEALYARNFKEIKFPGTTTLIPKYLEWRRQGKPKQGELCEGYGVTMRLQATREGTILREIENFFKSDKFWDAMAAKFGVNRKITTTDVGLQKYLDGYEISPHPDIRKKALTFMLNLNPAPNSEEIDIHTRYLTFKPEWAHVQQSWETDIDYDRCWVPWEWCDVQKQQPKNNSIVVFSPTNDTMHAVRANYDHLVTQRTQQYGNLWYKHGKSKTREWQEYVK